MSTPNTILHTTQATGAGQTEFRLRADARRVVRADVEWLARQLEERIRRGPMLRVGEMLPIGWMLCQVREDDDGTRTLWEPDWQTDPACWVEGVTATLQHRRQQLDAGASVGLSDRLQFPCITQNATVGADVDADDQELLVERTPGTDLHSGWFVGRPDGLDYAKPRAARTVSLYTLALLQPRLVPLLALPAGTRVDLGYLSAHIHFRGQLCDLEPGSYLSRWAQGG